MLAFLSLVLSLVAVVLILIIYWRLRKERKMSVDNLSNRVSGLLSEFNAVSSNNIEMLEEKTDELRRVVELADLKIDKLNKLIDRVQGARKKLKHETDQAEKQSSNSARRSCREKVLEMSEMGYSVDEIAEELGLKQGEVDVIIKFNRSRTAG